MRMRYGEAKHARILDKQNMHALWTRKTHMHYREHKKWVWCMAREINKSNSLHHQDLAPIVIF